MQATESDLIARVLRDDSDAFAGLVLLHARVLRTIIACYADTAAAIEELHRTVWSAARVQFDARPNGRPFADWLVELALPLIEQRLLAAEREAVTGKDPLRYNVVQAGLDELRNAPAGGNPARGLGERLVVLPAELQDLLRRRYQDGQTVATIATFRVVADSEIAAALAGARATLDWSGLVVPPLSSADSLLPVLIEDLLGGIIDPDSRSLLVASLMKDMERNRRFVRQVRLHLVLGAWLGPLDPEQAHALARPGVVIGGGADSGRSPVGGGGGRRARQTTGAAEPRRHGSAVGRGSPSAEVYAESARRGPPIALMVAGALVAVGLIAMWAIWARPAVTPPSGTALTAEQTPAASTSPASSSSSAATNSAPATRPSSAPGAPLPSGVFVRGVNLGGGEVTIERNRWLSQAHALAAGLSVAPGSDEVAHVGASGAGLEFDDKAMLEGGLRAQIGELHLAQEMPNGEFAVTLWIVAAQGNPGEGIALRLGGQDVPLGQAATRSGNWSRLGPYKVTVRNQRLDLALAGLRTQHLAGFAITAMGPFSGALPGAVTIAEPQEGARSYANQPLAVRADVSGVTAGARLDFFNGTTMIGSADKPPYRITWEHPTVGRFVLSARIAGATTASPAVSGTVATGGGSGTILREYWTGIGGILIANLTASRDFPDHPTGSAQEPALRAPIDWGDNYGQRLRGYITAPLSGSYLFWIAGDDEAELWLSQDEQPEHKTRIAVSFVEGNGIAPEEWERVPAQRSAPQALVAGRRYYVEVLHKEGAGGDHVEVGWQLPDGVYERPIPGVHLSPFVPGAAVPLAAPSPSPSPPVAVVRFVTGINLGGDAVVIDGNKWLGQKQAEDANAAVASGGSAMVALSDIEWATAKSANGDVHKNLTWENKPLTLRGVVHPKGLGVHAASEITYALAGRYALFMCDVGIDDETKGQGSAIFRVFVDGQQLFDSGVVTHGSPAQKVNVPVAGGKELKLVVTDGGNGNDWDHSDWAGARLLRAGPPGGLAVKSGRKTVAVMNPKPAVDAAMRGMLTSSLVGTAKEGVAFNVRVSPGTYQVYLWTVETSIANARLFEVELEGESCGEIGALPATGWAKYGPFPVTVEDGELNVVTKPKKGVPQLMGIAIFENATEATAAALIGNLPSPLIELRFDAIKDNSTPNTGSSATALPVAVFTQEWPQPSRNLPPGGGTGSLEFPMDPKPCVITLPGGGTALRGLKSFTISAWVNCRGKAEGRGGNRLLGCCSSGGDGVDLACREDGSISLGINTWNDVSGARRSSAGKITVSDQAPVDNWRFFAVAYDSTAANQQVRYYFGNATDKATLDQAVDYNRGAVGPNSPADLTIGHLGLPDRSDNTAAMFRGLIDQVRIWGSPVDGSGALSAEQIVVVQYGVTAAGK